MSNIQDLATLKLSLKELIIEECEKDEISVNDIDDNEELFGLDNPLQLDSIDALQISMALKNQYNILLADPKEFRRIVTSIDALANYIFSKNEA